MAKNLKKQMQSISDGEKWRLLKEISGYRDSSTEVIFTPDELNTFYARFEPENPIPLTRKCITEDALKQQISMEEVKQSLCKVKTGAASGPDKIPPCLLKTALKELVPLLTAIFNNCLKHEIFPKVLENQYNQTTPKG